MENLLTKWKDIDVSYETSIENLNYQQSKTPNTKREYSQIEMDAEFFKQQQRSNFEMSTEAQPKKLTHPLFENSTMSSLETEFNPNAKIQVEILQQMERQRLEILSRKVFDEIGWCPTLVKDNSTQNDILYIRGHCKKGSVIGFYPGMVYSNSLLKKAEEKCLKILKEKPNERFNRSKLQPYLQKTNQPQFYINGNLENELLFNTMYNHDDAFEDLTLSFDKKNVQQVEKTGGLSERLNNVLGGDETNFEKYGHYTATRFLHPFSLLNKSVSTKQHGRLSNVLAFPFVVPMSLNPSLFAYIPNRIADDKRSLLSGTGLIQSVVYIADRDLNDEPVIRESFDGLE